VGKREYGGKEDESSTGRIWAAGFQRVTARSRLLHILKLTNCVFLEYSNFFLGHKLRIPNQWIRRHDCTLHYVHNINFIISGCCLKTQQQSVVS
jgi:hypothetical protein